MSFGLGLAEGLATGLDTGLKKSMAEREERISTIAKLRAQSVIEESGKHATEFKSTKQAVRALAGMANNDMELVQYAVQEFGLDGAKDYITKLRKTSDDSGGVIKMASLVDLDRNNVPVSSAQIASTIVGPPTYLSDLEKSDSTRVRGFAGFFDDDISDNINNYTNQLVSAVNVNTSISDQEPLSPISSKGEKTWLINAPSDPEKRSAYLEKLTTLYLQKYINIDDKSSSEAIETLKIANEIKGSWEVENNLQSIDKQQSSMTDPQRLNLERKLVNDVAIQMFSKGAYIRDNVFGRVYEVDNADQRPIVNSISRHMSHQLFKVSNAKNEQGKNIDINSSDVRDVFMENLQRGLLTEVEIDYGSFDKAPSIVGFKTTPLTKEYVGIESFFDVFYKKIKEPGFKTDNINTEQITEIITPKITDNEENSVTNIENVKTYKDIQTLINTTSKREDKIKLIKALLDNIEQGKLYDFDGSSIRADQFKRIYSHFLD